MHRGDLPFGMTRGRATRSGNVPLYDATASGEVQRRDADVGPTVRVREQFGVDAPPYELHVRFTVVYTVTYWRNSVTFIQVIPRTHSGELVLNVARTTTALLEKQVKKALDKEWDYVKEVKEAQSEKGLDRQRVLFSYARPGEWETREMQYIPMHAATVLSYDDFDTEDRPTGTCVYDMVMELYAKRYKLTPKKLMRIFADSYTEATVGYTASRNRIKEDRYTYRGQPFTMETGVDASQLCKFASKMGVHLFGFGVDGECFIKFQAEHHGKKQQTKGQIPLVFLMSGGHLYFLKNRRAVGRLFNSSMRARTTNALQDVQRKGKADKQQARDRRGNYDKVKYDEDRPLDSYEANTSVYYTDSDDLSPVLYRVISEEMRVPGGVRINDGRVVAFCYDDAKDVFFYCCPDFESLGYIFAKLREERFASMYEDGPPSFLSESLATVGRSIFYRLNPQHREFQSVFNEEAECIFNDESWQPSYKAFYDVCETERVAGQEYVGVDISKCYTNAMFNSKYGWPVYSAFDEVARYDGLQLKTGYYYVKTESYFPLRGNGWYAREMVEYCLFQGIIREADIRYQFIASREIPAATFQSTVRFLFDNFHAPDAKMMMMFYGFFNRYNRTVKDRVLFTMNQFEAGHYFMKHQGAMVEEINTASFFEQWNTRRTRRRDHYVNLNPAERMDLGEKTLYRVDVKSEVKAFWTMRPVFCQIVQLGMIAVHRLWSEMGRATIVQIKTDSVLTRGGTVPEGAYTEYELQCLPQVDQIGMYKICTDSILDRMQFAARRQGTANTLQWEEGAGTLQWKDKLYEPHPYPDGSWSEWVFEVVEDYLFVKKEGFLITGRAGTGKTTFLKDMCKLIEEYEGGEDGSGMTVLRLAPTNKAALLVGGITVDKLFGSCGGNEFSKDVIKYMVGERVGYVVLDEASMVGENLWNKILWLQRVCPGVLFVVSGDFNQCMPVEGVEGEAGLDILCDSERGFVRNLVRTYAWDDKRKGRECDLTTDRVLQLIRRGGNLCHFCRTRLQWKSTDDWESQGSLDRIDNAQGHLEDNVNLCCVKDNLRRNDTDIYKYRAFGNIIDHSRHDYKNSWLLKSLVCTNRVKLLINKRSDDVMFDICKDVMADDVADHFGQNVFQWRNLVYTNARRKQINAMCMAKLADTTGGERLHFDAVDGDPYSQECTVQIGTPLLAARNDRTGLGVAKNEMFVVHHIDTRRVPPETDDVIVLAREAGDADGVVEVKGKDFTRYFTVAFAVTVHRSQGSTFDFPYGIFEFERMSRNLRYTALTRTSQSDYIFINTSHAVVFGKYNGTAV